MMAASAFSSGSLEFDMISGNRGSTLRTKLARRKGVPTARFRCSKSSTVSSLRNGCSSIH